MTFVWPLMLGALLLVPVLAGLYLLGQGRRRQLVARYGGGGSAPGPAGWRRHLPPAVLLAGWALLCVALARPQMVVSLPRVEGLVVLVFDVSGSMAAEDLKPTRLEAAKTAAQAFVERQPAGVLIGVVAFSDSGLAVQPPTDDQAAVLAAIKRLTPTRGTSLANGIAAALAAIAAAQDSAPPAPRFYTSLTPAPTPSPTPMPAGTYTSAAIVLLSDGENTAAPEPLAAAQAAADRGVRVYAVGVGSEAGADLTIDGFTVHSQLDAALLRQIAQLTGGEYSGAADEAELAAVYQRLEPRLVLRSEATEVTALFAGVSLLVLVGGGVLSLLWFSRLP
ncbi:MAG: VWA domain-containing protein [Anaerolineales bacterium]|nr:VWA domain-containing protein [Anaerolineales bacterium]